jgi:hypothetical protein
MVPDNMRGRRKREETRLSLGHTSGEDAFAMPGPMNRLNARIAIAAIESDTDRFWSDRDNEYETYRREKDANDQERARQTLSYVRKGLNEMGISVQEESDLEEGSDVAVERVLREFPEISDEDLESGVALASCRIFPRISSSSPCRSASFLARCSSRLVRMHSSPSRKWYAGEGRSLATLL